MAKFLICCAVLCALVGAIVALKAAPAAVSNRAGPVYLGYNATFCRGLNFTTYVPRGNCSAFYQCQGNNLWLNYCQYPLQYNHLNGYCDHPWNVRCNRTSRAANKVQSVSDSKILYPPVNQCGAHETVACFVDPCQFAKCGNIPEARCFSDYCRGCNARFFKINVWQEHATVPLYEEVTSRCL
ncbi:uncharacterized protein LOC129588587 isoform X1 [Paramacrobiotus metropolitanus]|uniref:uncharacterized protein LOC129588587 isoform X1 n=1 Tax=Paramacrobiotus metropolitanus TaxID=2943436 RepID=UPI0024458961|nr:uncharacterized protein LOC129588587 isoform X1 [Paramacrobiotus metropolitanus]